ncbi:MAG: gamma-glutamyltransferase [Acidobacteriota bacterium]|nr:gamma-glutamyltransferase [Acidobacteriota bacterium]
MTGRGIVAAGDKRTAAAGTSVFARGGNAADAAVAAAFASFVAEATVINIGCGGFALVVDSGGDRPAVAYDFFASMPSGRPDRTTDFREIQVDFGTATQSFWIGRGSTAVPGAVAGLCRLAREWGRLPLPELLSPAIALARDGFTMPRNMAYILTLLTDIFSDTPQLKQGFWSANGPKTAGDAMRFPKLAVSLERLAAEGPDYFYRGELAEQIVEDHRRNGGLITREDLAGYRARKLAPLRVDFRGNTVLLTPLPSHGGSLIAFSLALLAATPKANHPHNPRHLITLAHVMKLTNLARAEWGEGQTSGEPAVLERENIERWRARLHQALAGVPFPEEEPKPSGPGHTTHLSAVDADGLSVSITTSAGESAGYLIDDTGICLNNILGEADLNPAGWHRHQPGQHLFSMMCPTTVLNEKGGLALTLGSAGSNRIRSAILQTICNTIDFGMDPQAAVDAPRIHYEDGVLQCEGGIPEECAQSLERAGFEVKRWQERNLFFGGAQAVAADGDRLSGGADPRRHGAVRHG